MNWANPFQSQPALLKQAGLQSRTLHTCTCVCSAQLANLHNFEIVLRKLEIVSLQLRSEAYAFPTLRSQVYVILKFH